MQLSYPANFDNSYSGDGGAALPRQTYPQFPFSEPSFTASSAYINPGQSVRASDYQVPHTNHNQQRVGSHGPDSVASLPSGFGYASTGPTHLTGTHHDTTDWTYLQRPYQNQGVNYQTNSSHQTSLSGILPSYVHANPNFEIERRPLDSETPQLPLQPNSAQYFGPAYVPHTTHLPSLAN